MTTLASVQLVDLWAFVALAVLWLGLLSGGFLLYRWLWRQEAEEGPDLRLGL
jgi:hypothetical protein